MMASEPREIATGKFEEFYEYCLENGIEPESIVADQGEMLLLTNQEDVDRCQAALE